MQFSWNRLWCPPDTIINFDEKGYVLEPKSIAYSQPNTELLNLINCIKIPCLFLLGEPGIGKSFEFKKFYKYCKTENEKTNQFVKFVNLNDYPSDTSLENHVFHSKLFNDWVKSSSDMTLFFDSLDEGLLTIKQLTNFLIMWFNDLPIERLKLRITCRTTDWPDYFADEIQGLWGTENVNTFELIPLTRNDVYIAAQSEGLSPEEFLNDVEKKQVVPFAIKPITLRHLINIYKNNSNLPYEISELYRMGCQQLCDETSESRKASQYFGELTSYERMKVAGRIAVSTLFTNRSAISTNQNSSKFNSLNILDISPQDLVGEICFKNESALQVNERNIIEVVSTGLFSSRGSSRMGFSHQTYAEYLAAWYLSENEIPFIQLKQIFEHPLFSKTRIIPQLLGVINWLATFRNDVFDYVLQIDPIILLMNNCTQYNDLQKEHLVYGLLKKFDNNNGFHLDWSKKKNLAHLSHKNLVSQILPFLREKKNNINTRYFIIDLLEACEAKEISEVLSEIFLDKTEVREIRINAGWAICNIGNPENNREFLRLIEEPVLDDPDDDIRGICLLSNWPQNINNAELFKYITFPKDDSYYGIYSGFLAKLSNNISSTNILDALLWVDKIVIAFDLDISFEGLIESIIFEGWNQLFSIGVLDVFSRIVIKKLKAFSSIFPSTHKVNNHEELDFHSKFIKDVDKRHALIESVFDNLFKSNEDVTILIYSRDRIIQKDDFHWLLAKYNEFVSTDKKEKFADLLLYSINLDDMTQIDKLYRLSMNEPILSKLLQPIFGPIIINSDSAKRMKNSYAHQQEQNLVTKEPANLPNPKVNEKVETILNDIDNNICESWWKLNYYLQLSFDGKRIFSDYEFDITKLPSWGCLSESTMEIILDAAKKYILSNDQLPIISLENKDITRPQIAVFKAFYLLTKGSRQFISDLPSTIWQKWARIITLFPIMSKKGAEDNIVKEITKLTYENAKIEVLSIIKYKLESENSNFLLIFLERIDLIIDKDILCLLFKCIKKINYEPEILFFIVEKYLIKGGKEAESNILVLNMELDLNNEKDFQKSLTFSKALLSYNICENWESIWTNVNKNENFGIEFLLEVSRIGESFESQILNNLTAIQLQNLYVKLLSLFPKKEDPDESSFHTVTPREDVARFRDRIPYSISTQGSKESVAVLCELREMFQDKYLFSQLIEEAENNFLKTSWQPLTTKEFLCLISDTGNRVIQNGRQLLEVIVESLSQLELELHGETPASRFLWNDGKCINGDGQKYQSFTPKDENSLSDYIKLFLLRVLKDKGIIINREVEIRPTIGKKKGQITDIVVNAISKRHNEKNEIISAIIETKGSWNKQLNNSMKIQLIDRYLRENECNNGLYVIGWYMCEQWDNSDWRKEKSRSIGTLESARKQFESQAILNSNSSINILSYVLDVSL